MAQEASSASEAAREYVVVARRYRPQDFGELIGQQQVTQALCNAIATNRVGHAYLFTGARGVGKTSTARIFSKALNCVQGPTPTPCNACDICLSISTGEDVDVLEIDGASNRGIDEIRQLRANVNVRPSRARFKVYIIDEVHMLTREAFNALLKTLEEPPEHVKFIFCTTDPEKIPITVLSRCQRFDFPPVGTSAIAERLRQIVTAEGQTAQDEALELLARRAAGSLRDSQSLLEQLLSFCEGEITVDDVHAMLGTARSERIAALANRLIERDAGGALAELDAATRDGVNVGQLAEQLLGHLRDLLAVNVGCPVELLLHNPASERDNLQAAAERWGTHTLLAVAQIVDQAVARMRHSVDPRVLLEIALVRIASLADLQSLTELVGQVRGEIRAGAAGRMTTASSSSAIKKKAEVTNPTGPPRNVVVPEHDRESSIGHTASPDGNGSALHQANAEQVWREALNRLEGMVADFAARFDSVTSRSPNQLVVSFAPTYNSAKAYCERPEPMAQLERAVREITGRHVRIDLVANPSAAPSPPSAPRVVSTRDLMRQSFQHPFVKSAMEIFDGEIMKVHPPPSVQ